MSAADIALMHACLREAEAAERAGEVPVGAVVVREGRIVGRGHNRPIAAHDPSAHAEVVALRDAGAALARYRLPDCELLVTVEPCVMCVGALLQARVRRVVFGCGDPKAGALGGLIDLGAQPGFNHRFEVVGGVLAEEAAALLQAFFRRRRRAGGG